MIADDINVNPIYVAIYNKTGRPYIDTARNAYIFLKEEEAINFKQAHEGIEIEGPRYYKYNDICSTCFSAGAVFIKVRGISNNREENIELTKIEKRKYYNSELNKNLNLLHETKKKEYLLDIINNVFIVPVKINNESNSDIIIEYSQATIKGIPYFLAFSDVDEYTLWSSKVEGYKPLEISYRELVNLCHGDDCIINLFGSRYILTQEKIAKIDGNDHLIEEIKQKKAERILNAAKNQEQQNQEQNIKVKEEKEIKEEKTPKQDTDSEESKETIKPPELEEVGEGDYGFGDALPFSEDGKPKKPPKKEKPKINLPFINENQDTPGNNISTRDSDDNPFGEIDDPFGAGDASDEYIPPEYEDDDSDDDYMIFGNEDDES